MAAAPAAWVAALPKTMQLAVCGLHLRGQPLNWQLTDLGSTFVRACKSAPDYKLYAFTDASGRTKPGMVAVSGSSAGGGGDASDGGAAVELEVWDVPLERFGGFMLQVPAPLGIGTVQLEDGSSVKGFICEPWVAEACKAGDASVEDATHLGGWVAYLAAKQQQ